MGRVSRGKGQRFRGDLRRKLAVTAVVLASLAVMAGILVFVYAGQFQSYSSSSSYRMSFRLSIIIENATGYSNQYNIPGGIGIASNFWVNHTLDTYGVNNRAPIYTVDSSGIILVDSSASRVYTMGDFFNIWGNTLNSTCFSLYGTPFCNDAQSGFTVGL